MLKWMGTISAMAAAAVMYEKMKIDRRSELETVASIELRKVLRYAAPPTFLARLSTSLFSVSRCAAVMFCASVA